MSMNEQRIAYPPDFLQRLLSYLVTRPFGEVVDLINGLQTKGVTTEHPIDSPEALKPDEH